MHIPQVAINLVATADTVAKNNVGDGTREGYFNRLVELILWLHDHHQDILTAECKTALGTAKATDVRNRSKKHYAARECIKRFLRRLNSKDSSLSPINIVAGGQEDGDENEVLSWEIIAEYFDTKQKLVTVDRNLAMAFKKKLDDMSSVQGEEEEDVPIVGDANSQVIVAVRLEGSTYDGFRSAICHLYRESNVSMPDEFATSFSRYIKGSKRINLAAKQTLGLKITEGKSHMTIPVYEFICKTMFESAKPEHVFAHAFTVLDWNLMKRAENVVDAKIAHVFFSNDALAFSFSKSKAHQDGEEEYLGPWHVYANPQKPWLCPVLALARNCFYHPEVFSGSRALFEGKNSYSRYQKVFSQFLMEHEMELRQLGVEACDLGTHSARKGVGTLVAAGCTVAPPIVSICLRMGWSLGGVLGRYFKHGDAGDQSTGRMASKMNPMEEDYSVCRPYFDYTEIDCVETRHALRVELNTFLDDELPSDASAAARAVAREFFASICYHHDYLDDHLHATSAFRDSPFFKNIPEQIMDKSRIAFPWNSTADTPMFTGIPPHASLLAKQRELQNELKALRESIATTIADELNKRGVGCTQFFTQGIETAIQNLEINLKKHYEELVNDSNRERDELARELDDALHNYDVEEESEFVVEDEQEEESGPLLA